MGVNDVATSSAQISRFDSARNLLSRSRLLDELSERHNLALFSFGNQLDANPFYQSTAEVTATLPDETVSAVNEGSMDLQRRVIGSQKIFRFGLAAGIAGILLLVVAGLMNFVFIRTTAASWILLAAVWVLAVAVGAVAWSDLLTSELSAFESGGLTSIQPDSAAANLLGNADELENSATVESIQTGNRFDSKQVADAFIDRLPDQPNTRLGDAIARAARSLGDENCVGRQRPCERWKPMKSNTVAS